MENKKINININLKNIRLKTLEFDLDFSNLEITHACQTCNESLSLDKFYLKNDMAILIYFCTNCNHFYLIFKNDNNKAKEIN